MLEIFNDDKNGYDRAIVTFFDFNNFMIGKALAKIVSPLSDDGEMIHFETAVGRAHREIRPNGHHRNIIAIL